MAKHAKRTATPKVRPDGRKSFLTYLPADVIKDVKVTALKEDRHAYLIVEDAICSYLGDKRSLRKSKS